jgi:hypothetical protein
MCLKSLLMLNEAWRDSMMSLGASNTDLPGVLEAPKREEHISPFPLKQLLREWLKWFYLLCCVYSLLTILVYLRNLNPNYESVYILYRTYTILYLLFQTKFPTTA